VTTNEELKQQISKLITEMKQPALVEDFVDGREFHVALWGNDELEVLPAAEMDFAGISDMHQRLCDYDAKFTPDSELYNKIGTLLPAPLTAEEKENLESTCRVAYRATGCRDYARIDLRLRDGIFNVLDVNPNPDISSDASMACAADTLGISYGELGRRIVEMALERHPVLPARKLRPAQAAARTEAAASPA
jgi:D-alanine-D-alanine ligase